MNARSTHHDRISTARRFRWERLAVPLALLPALAIVGVLFGASVVYGVGQSLGYLPAIGRYDLTLAAYRNLVTNPDYAREFWSGLGFSLFVSTVSTLLSALAALLIVLVGGAALRRSSRTVWLLNVNLAFPHLVWAIGLVLLLAQSGLVARMAALLGLITQPAQFPVLVRDRSGIGIIVAYVSKETPFLVLLLLSVLQAQSAAYEQVATNLGASALQRIRYVTVPQVLPTLVSGALLVFAFVFGAYEVPAILGVRYPQVLSALALELFSNPDLNRRAEGMAISVIMALVVLAIALAARWLSARRDAV